MPRSINAFHTLSAMPIARPCSLADLRNQGTGYEVGRLWGFPRENRVRSSLDSMAVRWRLTIRWKSCDLIVGFGDEYRRYQRRVSILVAADLGGAFLIATSGTFSATSRPSSNLPLSRRSRCRCAGAAPASIRRRSGKPLRRRRPRQSKSADTR
jgi:hypothetical protein